MLVRTEVQRYGSNSKVREHMRKGECEADKLDWLDLSELAFEWAESYDTKVCCQSSLIGPVLTLSRTGTVWRRSLPQQSR